jgi:hypothetical protein
MQCSINQTTMINYTDNKRHKASATTATPKETPEEKAAREQKRAQFAALQLAKYGDPLAAIRAANPKQEIVTGSPYQAAREAWVNPAALSQGAFDHWTSQKA